jgi:Tfp pilus assembly protein PilE
MAVIAIMGILAAIAVTAFHRRAFQSDVAQAKVVIKAIAIAEEHYRAENQVYFDVRTSWYPQPTIPPNTKVSFWKTQPDGGSPDTATAAWAVLAPDIREMVNFSFIASAGLPDTAPSVATGSGITLPANVAVEPWYLIQARADADGDATYCYVAVASWSPEVAVTNEGE